jgi:hypothetical protein
MDFAATPRYGAFILQVLAPVIADSLSCKPLCGKGIGADEQSKAQERGPFAARRTLDHPVQMNGAIRESVLKEYPPGHGRWYLSS